MKKEGATDQAGDDGEGYVDEFLLHVLSFLQRKILCSTLTNLDG